MITLTFVMTGIKVINGVDFICCYEQFFLSLLSITADEWIPAIQGLTDRTSLMIRDLTTGDKLQFRVRAFNMAGPSAASTLAQPVTIREIMRQCFQIGVTVTSFCLPIRII